MKVRDVIKVIEDDGWYQVKMEIKMYRFLVIIEEGDTNYGAYAPDLPGCVAVGDTREEVEEHMRQAIRMHLRGILEDQEPIPTPHTSAEYMDIVIPDSAA